MALAIASVATAATPKVTGTVGPGFTITLKKAGKKVTKLKAGKVTFVICDKSSIHNYDLDGPKGFEKTFTSVPFKGTKTVTVTLKAGKYKFTASRTRARCSATSPSRSADVEGRHRAGCQRHLPTAVIRGYSSHHERDDDRRQGAPSRGRRGLLGGTLGAWVMVIGRMRGMDAGPGTDLGSVGWYLGIWVTMMAAMMLPSATPMVLFFAKVAAQSPGRPALATRRSCRAI